MIGGSTRLKDTAVRLGGAVVVMVAGSSLVFGLMLVMNGFQQPPPEPDFGDSQSFQVAPKPEPPQRPEPKPKPKKAKPRKTPQKAPPPSLSSPIGSVGLEMPGFSPEGAEKASRELVGDVQASVMTADAVDQKPEPLNKVRPQVSRRLVAKQQDGSVLVKALVGTDGAVQRVKVVRSTPEGMYDRAVLEAVRQWRFKPASYKGKAVKTWIEVPFEFGVQ